MSVESDLRATLAEEQRRASLRGSGIPSLEAVHKRRHQVAFVVAMVAVALLVATLIAVEVIDTGDNKWVDSNVARIGFVALAVVIVAYAFVQERHLRRVVQQRLQLLALDEEIAGHLLGAGILLDAVIAMHTPLALDETLEAIVEQGRGLVGRDQAVLFLTEEERPMAPAVDHHDLADSARPVMTLVEERRSVVGIVEGDTVDIGVPIAVQDDLLAVLVIPGVTAPELTGDLKELMNRFASSAAAALVNARRYEAAMFLLDVSP